MADVIFLKSQPPPRHPHLAFDEPFAVDQAEYKGKRAAFLEWVAMDITAISGRNDHINAFAGLQVNADMADAAFQFSYFEIFAGFFNGVYPLRASSWAVP
jgi:hypothetical protein